MREMIAMERRERPDARWGGSRPFAVGATIVALGAAVALGGACKPKRKGTPPLCAFQAATNAELESQSLKPVEWFPIVSPSIDRAAMTRTGPLRDACGRVLEGGPAAFAGCPGPPVSVVSKPGDPVALEALVLSQVGKGRLLVWAATEALSDGDSLGPAALVFWTESGLEVHATGLLRGYAKRARMRLHHSRGVPVVILEAQRCESEGRCVPEATFAPILGRRFQDLPLYDAEGSCLGRARFELERRLEQPISGGFTRRFELQRTIELAEEGVVIIDLVTGEEYDPADPTATARPFRRVSTRRALELEDDHFVIRDRDLWTHVLRDYGLVRGDGDAPRERSDPTVDRDGKGDDDDDDGGGGGVTKKTKTTKKEVVNDADDGT
jgi:hypothetical protein